MHSLDKNPATTCILAKLQKPSYSLHFLDSTKIQSAFSRQGLIARGDHFGSLVEKDLEPPKIHIDEQVTGFEGSVRRLDDFHTWHGATFANELHMQLQQRNLGHDPS